MGSSKERKHCLILTISTVFMAIKLHSKRFLKEQKTIFPGVAFHSSEGCNASFWMRKTIVLSSPRSYMPQHWPAGHDVIVARLLRKRNSSWYCNVVKPMARESTVPRQGSRFSQVVTVSNCLLNIYLYIHRSKVLSTLLRKALPCSRYWLRQRGS